jgi:hypothetical protein
MALKQEYDGYKVQQTQCQEAIKQIKSAFSGIEMDPETAEMKKQLED